MPIGHILAPLIAKKAAEIEAAMTPQPIAGAGYLTLPPGSAPVSERQAYASLDKDRAAQAAGDDVRTRALEAMGSRGTRGEIDGGTQVGDTNIDRHARINRLANKSTWTGADLNGVTEGELAAARMLRKQREAEGVQPNAIQSPGYLPKISVGGTKRNPRINADEVRVPLEGVRVGPAYTGPALGNTVTPQYKPVSLGDMLRGASPEEAAQIISNEMQKKQLGYLGTMTST